MTTLAPDYATPALSTRTPSRPSYANAHWYLLAALAVVVAGFWPTFFRPLTGGDARRNFHGVTATLWYAMLILQSWLMSRGQVTWHRRVARSAVVLLPVLCVSMLANTRVMVARAELPVAIRLPVALLGLTTIAFLVALVVLGLRNRRTPAAHKRYMCATALMGFLPALARFFLNQFAPRLDFFGALHAAFFTTEAVLVALIVADWRMGEKRWAYPLTLAFHVTLQLTMVPIAGSAAWIKAMEWFAGGVRLS